MKKYPKLVQCDKRGQIVIPKDVRDELGIDEGTGFWVYSIYDEGLLLKKISPKELHNDSVVEKIQSKSSKIKINKKNVEKAISRYKKRNKSVMEEV